MRDIPSDLLVAEVFGPTLQGEGPSAGRRCGFIRLAACNLNCSWCDTPYTWDWTGQNGTAYDPRAESKPMALAELIVAIEQMAVNLLVVSGGEPLLQDAKLVPLLRTLRARGLRFEVETNGTKSPTDELAAVVDRFNVSPKLTHSGIPYDKRIRPSALERLYRTKKAVFKFVCQRPEDLEEVGSILDLFGPVAPDDVWVMPEGTDPLDIELGLRKLAPGTIDRGWNLTSRLHVMLWGHVRGR